MGIGPSAVPIDRLGDERVSFEKVRLTRELRIGHAFPHFKLKGRSL